MKTQKSYTKRMRVTKRGKILTRKAGQDHYKAKEPRSDQMRNKRAVPLVMSQRAIRRFLPSSGAMSRLRKR